MGSPLSSLLADIYLNQFENQFLISDKSLVHKKIIFYKRYVDDTFFSFDETERQINQMVNKINRIYRKPATSTTTQIHITLGRSNLQLITALYTIYSQFQ